MCVASFYSAVQYALNHGLTRATTAWHHSSVVIYLDLGKLRGLTPFTLFKKIILGSNCKTFHPFIARDSSFQGKRGYGEDGENMTVDVYFFFMIMPLSLHPILHRHRWLN